MNEIYIYKMIMACLSGWMGLFVINREAWVISAVRGAEIQQLNWRSA